MGDFVLYNEFGEIIQTGHVPDGMEEIQGNADENCFVFIGNADPGQHKIIDGKRIRKTKEEIESYRFARQSVRRVKVSGRETDEELNQLIFDHFNGKINIKEYKVQNYYWLREKFYPSIFDFIDGTSKVKIESKKEEGEQQLEDYWNKIEEIKTRFPKE